MEKVKFLAGGENTAIQNVISSIKLLLKHLEKIGKNYLNIK